jgi:hypothetical protein
MVYVLLAVPAIVATSVPQASGSMTAGTAGASGTGGTGGTGHGGGMGMLSHGGDMAGGGGARLPLLGLILAVLVCGYIVWLADRIQRFSSGSAGSVPVPVGAADNSKADHSKATVSHAPAALLAPRAATCCKIAMGVAMGVMLIDLL